MPQSYNTLFFLSINDISFFDLDIVHENLKMGSDGESDQASGTSSDEVQSPTGVCLRNRIHRRISMEVIIFQNVNIFLCVCVCVSNKHTHTLSKLMPI